MAAGKYQRWLEPEGLTLLEAWVRDGLSEEEIAEKCGVGAATLCRWKEEYPPVREALKGGREAADAQVEKALLRRALGYRYDDVTREERLDKNTGESRMVVTKIVSKEAQPDVSALIFWLKNRRQGVWRDRPKEDGAQTAAQRPDDGLRAALEEAVRRVCAGGDDSSMLPEGEKEGDERG